MAVYNLLGQAEPSRVPPVLLLPGPEGPEGPELQLRKEVPEVRPAHLHPPCSLGMVQPLVGPWGGP